MCSGQFQRLPQIIKCLRGVIKYFKHATTAKALVKDLRVQMGLGPGLESIGKTRFGTLIWSSLSLRRCLPAIRHLCTTGVIDIPVGFFQLILVTSLISFDRNGTISSFKTPL
jgi:hypothetical protein